MFNAVWQLGPALVLLISGDLSVVVAASLMVCGYSYERFSTQSALDLASDSDLRIRWYAFVHRKKLLK
jgi:hypothetical protein